VWKDSRLEFTPRGPWQSFRIASSSEEVPDSGPISQIAFSIAVRRLCGFYVLKVFVPLLLLVVLSGLAFWIDESELSSQVTISITALLTVIAFGFAVQINLPKVSYSTFIDTFFLISYGFVFISSIVAYAAKKSGNVKRTHEIITGARSIVPLGYVMLN